MLLKTMMCTHDECFLYLQPEMSFFSVGIWIVFVNTNMDMINLCNDGGSAVNLVCQTHLVNCK